MSVVDKAAELADLGLAVFPCLDSKAPALPRGFKAAVRGGANARKLWQAYPGPLIGVATGEVSGISVLDLDLQHDDAKAWHEEHCVRLAAYRAHRTRSGGLHIVFLHREGIRNRAALKDPSGARTTGVDVRGDGGYIIWHPANGLPVLNDVEPEPWPAWLAEMAIPTPPRRTPVMEPGEIRSADRYIEAAIRSAYRTVATAPEGRRNDCLNAETFGLARFVDGGHLTSRQIADVMQHAAQAAGLTPHETSRTIASALRARGVTA